MSWGHLAATPLGQELEEKSRASSNLDGKVDILMGSPVELSETPSLDYGSASPAARLRPPVRGMRKKKICLAIASSSECPIR